MNLFYYRSHSFPEVWANFFTNTENFDERYELVEKKDYKKKRLSKEIEQEELRIESYKRYLDESEKKLKTLRKELSKID